jgi:hypothetical protein
VELLNELRNLEKTHLHERIKQRTENEAILALGETNIISFNAIDTSLTGYLNSEEVFTLEDSTFASGGVSIYMATTNAGRTDVAIDTYEVVAALSPTNLMTGCNNSITGDEATETTTEEAED